MRFFRNDNQTASSRFTRIQDIKAFYRRHEQNITNTFIEKEVQKKLLSYHLTSKKQIVVNSDVTVSIRIMALISCCKDAFKYAIKVIW